MPEGGDRTRSIPFEERPVELFDRFSPVRSHSPDICEICILVENHGKGMRIKLRESVPQSPD
jgi:hypothetical protein